MYHILKRLSDAAQNPPINGQQGMGQFRRVLATDLQEILEIHNKNHDRIREQQEQIAVLCTKVKDLNKELEELQASVFIPLDSL